MNDHAATAPTERLLDISGDCESGKRCLCFATARHLTGVVLKLPSCLTSTSAMDLLKALGTDSRVKQGQDGTGDDTYTKSAPQTTGSSTTSRILSVEGECGNWERYGNEYRRPHHDVSQQTCYLAQRM
jgi:hypothetical protein